MFLAQIGLSDAGIGALLAAYYGIIALFASFFSLIGLVSGLIAFATSFAWRRWPRLDELFAASAVICLACYIAIWVEWGQIPTNWQTLFAVFIGPSVGIVSAWRSNVRRSGLGKRLQAEPDVAADGPRE
jgi:hypothetical protein